MKPYPFLTRYMSSFFFFNISSYFRIINIYIFLITQASVLKVHIYCIDMNEYAQINTIYRKYFDSNNAPPARVCVQVKELPLGAKVEMCVVAVEDVGEANL